MKKEKNNIVKTDDLVFEYIRRDEDGNVEGITTAVDHVDISIKQGDFVAILGHNGSGKSTLAKHLNAILYPTEGTVWVDGKDTKDEDSLIEIRKEAGQPDHRADCRRRCGLWTGKSWRADRGDLGTCRGEPESSRYV